MRFFRNGGQYPHANIAFQSPYMPTEAQRLSEIPAGSVPFISQVDLFIFKMNSCGLRAQEGKKRIDALDAMYLLEDMASPLRLTAEQQAIVEPCIADVVAHTETTEDWWRQRLGLSVQRSPPRQTPATEYWTWSEEYQNYYHLHEDGTYEWATQAGSSTAQQSDARTHGRGSGRHRHR
jgi:hypothetical protein